MRQQHVVTDQQHDRRADQHLHDVDVQRRSPQPPADGRPRRHGRADAGFGDDEEERLGGTFIPTNIAHAIVGHYTQTATELETQFLDLETIAQTLYPMDIPYGTVLDFSMLMDKGGNAFKGIDSTGTWLVALVCTTCRNPAPWYLTILQPNPASCNGGSGSSSSVTCTDGTIVANEMNNYSFSSSLMLHPVKVKQMSDLTFDWSAVTKDFLGHPVSAKTDLNTIFLLMVNMPAAGFEMTLNDDTFSTTSLVIPGPPPSYMPANGETSKSLYNNFVTGDGPATPALANMYLDATKYTPANTTFAIAAQSGTDVGTGQIDMLQSFELEAKPRAPADERDPVARGAALVSRRWALSYTVRRGG